MAVAFDRHPRRRPLRRGPVLARGASLRRRAGAEGPFDAGAGTAAGEGRSQATSTPGWTARSAPGFRWAPLASGVPMGASHGIGYVLGAVFDVPHGYTSCVMLPSVMRWNKPANAERQALVSAAMGQPGKDAGDVLDGFIRGLGMPRSLQDVRIGPEHFDRIAHAGDGDAVDTAQPAQDRRAGAGARDSSVWPHRILGNTMYTGKHAHLRPLQPAFIMASTGEAVTYAELEARSNRLAHLLAQSRPQAARPLCHLHGEQQPLPRGLRRRRALRTVFHLREFLPDGKRACLHRHQQRIAHPYHVARQARGSPRGAAAMPEAGTLHRGRWRERKRAHRRPAAGHGRLAQDADRGRDASAPRCFIRPAPPAGRKASCGRCRSSRRNSRQPCSISCTSSGTTARA